ncbi:uncharacterized protein BDR25DRAFT_395095 [Lindgomyces ingoldianus]|uniref:Uncharacterized protein n=1 Tax=Lindgomyces ingoldianus TaxID=673940 RepID=A0ACB6QM02_9PLEO|nr:uncharacterized protein BDR25DRAFT_395095 [Lindgomyces ingoldianus]KAF2467941.1 hypothetical protein BDR25DRAFT_395095 [Lindgomyces ingoldianus]
MNWYRRLDSANRWRVVGWSDDREVGPLGITQGAGVTIETRDLSGEIQTGGGGYCGRSGRGGIRKWSGTERNGTERKGVRGGRMLKQGNGRLQGEGTENSKLIKNSNGWNQTTLRFPLTSPPNPKPSSQAMLPPIPLNFPRGNIKIFFRFPVATQLECCWGSRQNDERSSVRNGQEEHLPVAHLKDFRCLQSPAHPFDMPHNIQKRKSKKLCPRYSYKCNDHLLTSMIAMDPLSVPLMSSKLKRIFSPTGVLITTHGIGQHAEEIDKSDLSNPKESVENKNRILTYFERHCIDIFDRALHINFPANFGPPVHAKHWRDRNVCGSTEFIFKYESYSIRGHEDG